VLEEEAMSAYNDLSILPTYSNQNKVRREPFQQSICKEKNPHAYASLMSPKSMN
jgi:hypothetical protein